MADVKRRSASFGAPSTVTRSSLSRLVSFLVILAGLANFTYAIYFEFVLIDHDGIAAISKTRPLFGGPWKYLTFWNLWVQLVYFVLAFLNLLFGSECVRARDASPLQRARDFYFATLALPIGVFVGLMFWGLFAVNRDLVFPARFDAFIPPLENHMLHTAMLVLQPLNMLTTFHAFPASRARGMATTGAFCLLYLSWLCYIAFAGGFWVYPVFKVLTPPLRAAFMAVCVLLGGVLYLVGEVLSKLLWQSAVSAASSKKKSG